MEPGNELEFEKVILSKPFSFEGKEYTELVLDLDSLTGNDMINAAKESRVIGDTSAVPEMSKTYLVVLAARAAKVPVDMLLALPGKDFSKVTIRVQDFLFE